MMIKILLSDRRFGPLPRLLFLVTTLLLSFGPAHSAPSPSIVAVERAAPFELKDQYNQTNVYRFPRSKPTIFVFGDRRGSEQIEGWVRPVWDRYQERVDQKGVAVLSAVPAFMRGIIRSMFRSKVKYPVLLDWTGDVARSYSYQSGKAILVLIDQQGEVVLRLDGPVSRNGLQLLYARIDRLVTAS
ncbi:MAG: hypothetical protein EBU88_06580 [Acidobacteria bacterium]|nr:hypothetical protein [Acidobacteriota bacterium]